MYPLREFQAFKDLMINMGDNPILGVGVGTIFTWLVQSSSGSIGILQELYSQGQISIEGAYGLIWEIIWDNNHSYIAAIGASVPAKTDRAINIILT